MENNPLIQLYLSLPQGVQMTLGIWLFMFFMRLVDWIFFRNNMYQRWGLIPLRSETPNHILSWVLFSFIHSSWGHFWSNSIPFLILGSIIAVPNTEGFVVITAVIMMVAALGIWLIQRGNTATVGSSVFVTGFLGYILLIGIFTRSSQAFIIAVIVFAFYYGMLRLVFIPQEGNVSNVGHFFGFIGGGMAAWTWSFMLANQVVL